MYFFELFYRVLWYFLVFLPVLQAYQRRSFAATALIYL
nr:MAG TPA: hypothetical protein [Bacteriophage sp.]